MSRRPDHIPKRRAFSKVTKEATWARAGGRCERCDTSLHNIFNMGVDINYDHHTPVAFGGDNSLENCRLLCSTCNAAKGKVEAKMALRADKMSGRVGQQARRKKRKKPLMQSKGFDKTLTKKMDGTVVRRKK